MNNLESTFKYRDVEELIDIYLGRRVGYLFAKMARSLNMTPNMVTLISIFLGLIAGHLFYYSSLTLTLAGIFLLLFATFLDSADGQLARMTNSISRLGRFLDGFSGYVIYTSIYLHICFRYIHTGGSNGIFLFALVACISHGIQCAWADCYRNAYLYFVSGPKSNEIENSIMVKHQYDGLSWRNEFLRKFFQYIYLKYVNLMEWFSKNLVELKSLSFILFNESIPQWFVSEYRQLNKPMIKYYNTLTINTRQYTLFILLLLKHPEWYFLFEIVVLNFVLLYAGLRQTNINFCLIKYLKKKN